jgi:aldehyde:ferredoxin oxidoreductase
MHGFHGRLLRIDLDSASFSFVPIPDETLRRTLGGKGLGVELLLTENPVGVDPLSAEAVFVIGVGPVTGTKMWSQSRFGVYAKSPATGGWGESYCGGRLAPVIKGCGVDAVLIRGRRPALSWLEIDERGVTFHDAARLAGAESYATEDELVGATARDGIPAGAMVIGPAGENLVRFACIKTDRWRSLGRGGMGAVLGAKNVKGVAFRGATQAPVASPEELAELMRLVAKRGREADVTARYQKYGTPMQVAVTNAQNCFPTRYWQSGHHDKWQNLSGDYMVEHFTVTRHGCPNCFLQCTKHCVIREGRHAGLEVDGPEYETIYALGGLNCLDSLEEVAWLNDVCDRLGIDTMSAGNISAFATEARARGKLDFGIEYNQPDRMAELFRLIARAEGPVGRLFGRGIKEASEELGLADLAVHVKGLEPAGFDPRVLKGMGLSYATAARGACHLRGTFYKAELSGQIDKSTVENKAVLQIDYEDRAAIFDSLILCRFFRDFILWDELRTLIRATTGLDMDKPALELLANRTTQRTREYNRREGIGPEADRLPSRFLKEATAEGARLTEAELATMVADYNRIREERQARDRVSG